MDNVYVELDEVKSELEKLKEECQVKTKLAESLKKSHCVQSLKFQEFTQQTEKQALELDLKSEEISELRNINEDLKSTLHEKEIYVRRLSSENEKIRGDTTERLLKLEEKKRELLLALDELTTRNNDLEQNACASNEEILGLKRLLSVAQKRHLEAEGKAQEVQRLRNRDDVIVQMEEENRNLQDKMKWKSEQFDHLEEAHEKLQGQFQSSNEEWEREKFALLEEISSLQTSLDSQTRTLEAVQSRLETCNRALAHEESRRKLLEVEISEFKSRFEDVFTQCEEEKSKMQSLTVHRNEEIANLRNSLGEKETLLKETELKIVHLIQENQELGDSLKELREAQIRNAGAHSLLSKLRNKLKRLEEAHRNCSSNMKSKESQWDIQVEKMEGEMNTYKSTLTSKEREIRELQMELENCHYAIEEISVELLIFKSELTEVCSKVSSLETDKAVFLENANMISLSPEQLQVEENSLKAMAQQNFIMEEELQRLKKLLEESSEEQLVLKEQLLLIETTLKDERSVALEAQRKLKLELANKNIELSRSECELQNWKSTAETLKVRYDKIQGTCQKINTFLLSQREKEKALENEKESLLCNVKDLESTLEDFQQRVVLLEMQSAEKMKEAETIKQERETLAQIVEQNHCCLEDLQKDLAIACLKQENMRKESEAAAIAQLNAEKALEQEKERLMKIINKKDEVVNYFQKLTMSLEKDLIEAVCSSFSKEVEKMVMASVLTGTLKNAEYLTKLEVEEKNRRIGNLELEVNNLLDKVACQEGSLFHLRQQVEHLQASIEAKKLETENMESIIRVLECVRGNLLQDIMRFSTERDVMLALMEDICNRVGEFSGQDMQMMNTLGNILNTWVDENGIEMDSVECNKLYDSTKESENGSFSATTKKLEASVGRRSPLREVNSLHM